MHHVLNTICFSFHSHKWMCACEITDIEALVQSTHGCVHYHLHEHTCMSITICTHQTWFEWTLTYIWIVKQGWRYKLYEHVLVLRHNCDSHYDTRRKRHWEFLTVKLKPIYHIWAMGFYRLSLVILGQCDKLILIPQMYCIYS